MLPEESKDLKVIQYAVQGLILFLLLLVVVGVTCEHRTAVGDREMREAAAKDQAKRQQAALAIDREKMKSQFGDQAKVQHGTAESPVDEFKRNKAALMSRWQGFYEKGQYRIVIDESAKYLLVNDPDLNKVRGQSIKQRDELRQDQAEIQRQEEVQKLVSQVKSISSAEIETLAPIYSRLVSLEPNNVEFKTRNNEVLLAIADKKKKERLALEEKKETQRPAASLTKRIKGTEWFGSTDRNYFEKLITYAVQGDTKTFSLALANGILEGTCTMFADGEVVYVMDTAVFSGLLKIRREGEAKEYWTNLEAVK